MKDRANFFGRYWMFIVPVFIIVITVATYCLKFGLVIMDNTPQNHLYERFGQFGDYFGGVLNPILAFINILLIVYYQNNDFKKQQESQNNKAEKDQILGLIAMHCSLRDQLVLLEGGVEIKGLALFNRFDKEVRNSYSSSKIKRKLFLGCLERAYVDVYEENFRKQYLGHYFRSLYHVYKYIDTSVYIAEGEKESLAKILRSQISHLELKLLFLNAISEYGKSFQYYIGKYDILEWFWDSDYSNYDENLGKSKIVRRLINHWSKIHKSGG